MKNMIPEAVLITQNFIFFIIIAQNCNNANIFFNLLTKNVKCAIINKIKNHILKDVEL